MLRILDPRLHEQIDILKLVLLYSDQFSLLPELYDVFGQEKLLKFLDTFSGTTVKVPPADVLERAVRDISIYLRLKKVTQEKKAGVIRSISSEMLLSETQIRQIYHDVSEIVEKRLGFKFLLSKVRNGKKESEEDQGQEDTEAKVW